MPLEVESSRLNEWLDAMASRFLAASYRRGRFAAGLHAFFVFGIKQAWVCLFGGLMIALLLGTYLWFKLRYRHSGESPAGI